MRSLNQKTSTSDDSVIEIDDRIVFELVKLLKEDLSDEEILQRLFPKNDV